MTTQDINNVSSHIEAFNAHINTIDKKMEDFAKIKESLKEEFEVQVKEVLKEFFIAAPKIKALSWQQYTPYFNDGDSCTFSFSGIYFLNYIPEYNDGDHSPNEDEDNEQDNEQELFCVESYDIKDSQFLTEEEKTLCTNLNDMFENYEEFLEGIYGDHVSVLVTPEETTIDEYDHD